MSLTYIGYNNLVKKKRQETLAEVQEALNRMIPSELNSSYQIKMVSTAKLVPSAAEGEADKLQGEPVIVDEVTQPMITGVKQAIQFHPNTSWADEEATDLTDESDTQQILVKKKIIQTDDVSELPEFPGGARAFMHWLDENIVYPRFCLKRGIEGEVTVSFIVGTDGYPYDFKVVKASNELFAQAALNVLKRMPQWKPGKQPDGRPTPVMITIPVLFKK